MLAPDVVTRKAIAAAAAFMLPGGLQAELTGSRITDLIEDVLKQSHERGLKRIRTLTLPVGQGHPYEVVDVRYG